MQLPPLLGVLSPRANHSGVFSTLTMLEPTRMGIGSESAGALKGSVLYQSPAVLVVSGLAPLGFLGLVLHKHCFMCPPTLFFVGY